MEKEESACIADKWKGRHVNVLGEEYTIFPLREDEDDYFEEAAAFVDFFKKRIVINKEGVNCDEDVYVKATLRHEIIHAFLYESGLENSSASVDSWATNEEMVDWIALQSPKIFGEFSRLELI